MITSNLQSYIGYSKRYILQNDCIDLEHAIWILDIVFNVVKTWKKHTQDDRSGIH